MNKAETRAQHIDPALKAAGWRAIEASLIRHRRKYTLMLKKSLLHHAFTGQLPAKSPALEALAS